MNIEAQLQETGARLWAEHADLRSDVQQRRALDAAAHGPSGPMLFGQFSIADAFFAPVCMRLNSYGLPTSTVVRDYVQRVTQLPSTQEWIQAALAEQDFLQFEEPYRQHR